MTAEERMAALEARVAELEPLARRVAELEDIEAVKEAKNRFALAADPVLDVEALVALFTEDATLEYTGGLDVKRGHSEIRAWFENDPIDWRVHFFLPIEIRIDSGGKTARGKWFMFAPLRSQNYFEDRVDAIWCVASYDDELRKMDGTWLFSHVRTHFHIMAPHDKGWAETLVDAAPYVKPETR